MINLDKVITKKEVVAALCLVLGKPALNEPWRPYKRSCGVQNAVVQLVEADALRLLQFKK